MITYTAADIEALEQRYRTRLVNALGGAKSANLIGTTNELGHDNLALFSSVIHVGANPPLIGFVMRPIHVERHTYANICENGHFTINAVRSAFRQNAHQTSAKYPRHVSEFDACGLTRFYNTSFPAPFVKESAIQIGCILEEDIPITSNGARLIIGRIALINIADDMLRQDGSLDLHAAQVEAITGLDSWHPIMAGTRYSHALPNEQLHTITDD